MTSELNLPLGTIEYVKASVTADVPLDTQVVAMSLDSGATWLPATWVGTAGTTRQVRTTSVVDFNAARSVKWVLVKITDGAEIPIVKAGRISVSG